MPKVRKRKTPITSSKSSTTSSTPESSRVVIRRFHTLLKRQSQLRNKLIGIDNENANANTVQELAEIQNEIDEMGGLNSYQRMSTIGQGSDRGGGSERVLIQWLKAAGLHKSEKKFKLLEVGALKPDNYHSCSSWIETAPIDLNSRHPSILEQDFLLMDEIENAGKWDILSLSLVLNFVPDVFDRGEFRAEFTCHWIYVDRKHSMANQGKCYILRITWLSPVVSSLSHYPFHVSRTPDIWISTTLEPS
ncbi:hypothetical protein E1B28_008559 [Marasmius oreades]|uniref:25S rRNA adenine-N(1) methyltransferase n=1 Tax=Marasmius oreades TaxID=181124 RepID=A0A9P7UTE3_9AGAR|nr:uncharacterized protein E1B28_008559 [Marasmius oreades]KAG7092191.1 hypothetical protein E1B28_008559 [Marasmius oreades]